MNAKTEPAEQRFSERVGFSREKSSAPLYLQVQKTLRNAINGKIIAENDVLPAERELAEDFSVSRITIRKAIDGLVDEGLLTRRRGSGTFVTSRVEKSFSKLTSFSEDMISRGRKPMSEWISKSMGAVTPEEALALDLSPGAPVYRFHRIRYADGMTMALEYATIPEYCLSSLEILEDSLYDALGRNGYRPVRALQRLRAINFSNEQARILQVKPGDAGLYIERRGFMADGRPTEYTQSWYRGDAYDVIAELNDNH